MSAINVNNDQFQELLKGEQPVLVDYWAPWCVYCRRLQGAYDKVAEAYADRLQVVKINIDEEGDLAVKEQIKVIPTLVLYKDGRALDSVVAPGSKAEIDEFLERNLRG